MYTNVWIKYLPIIRIVLKKAVNQDQTLALNVPDFERVGLTRKTGYKFAFIFNDGRLSDVIIDHSLASSLAAVMLEDEAIKNIITANNFHISLNPKFELSIKRIQQPEPVAASEK
ncbi:MAG: hypothetical protein C4329_05030 [Chitinophagaceae bacterium]